MSLKPLLMFIVVTIFLTFSLACTLDVQDEDVTEPEVSEPEVQEVNELRNLAFNRPVDSKSQLNQDATPFKAVDGNMNTAWKAADDSFPQWITVDLGVISDLESVQQVFESDTIWTYRIEASNDNVNIAAKTWTVLVDRTAEGVTGSKIEEIVEGHFRYVRLVVTGSEDGSPASSQELQVMGITLEQPRDLVPVPVPVSTGDTLVIAQTCNLWAGERWWSSMLPTQKPELISIMGMYNEAYDVATDWQIKVAVENGISGFFSCWFRQKDNAGKPVMASFEGMVSSLANTAQYRDMIQWAIQFENRNDAADGIEDYDDFVNNLVPFWIEEYFSKPNYLKVDGKPVISIYSHEHFIDDIGGNEKAQEAIAFFRNAVDEAGFDGLILMTADNANTTSNFAIAKQIGFDYIYNYHIPTFMSETRPPDGAASEEYVSAHEKTWNNYMSNSQLPYVLTASVGWDSLWGYSSRQWALTKDEFIDVLGKAKNVMEAQPAGSLESRMILLDNWNEYGEGHSIFPIPKYGFDYVNAVRELFSDATEPPENRLPDISVIPQVLTVKHVTSIQISGSGGENTLNFPARSMQMEYITYPLEDDGIESIKWEIFATNGVSKTTIATINAQGLLAAEESGVVRVVATVNGQPDIKATALITIDLTPPLESENGNLALGKKTEASSYANYGDSGIFPPNQAVDGTEDTMWLVAGTIFPSFLTVDLGQEFELSRFVQIFTGDGTRDVHFIVEGSVDGTNFTTLHTTDHTDKGLTIKTFDEEIEGTYQYVRITFLGGIDWPNSRQFEVYGPENDE